MSAPCGPAPAACPARPGNAYRLLREQDQLALVFPEGTKGPSKSYTDRYQLRRFGRGGFVEIAMRAGVPVIPIAVVGSEEAMPVVFRLPTLAKALGVPYVPVTANLLTMGPLGLVMPFPGKIQAARPRPGPLQPPPGPGPLLEEPHHGGIRADPYPAPGGGVRHAAGPAQRVVRMSNRVLVTGADTFWGGRMTQALENDPSIDVILGIGTHAPSVPFERAEFVRSDQNYSILNRIVKATQVDTILHTFMITNSTTVPRRAMHEINVIGTMNLLAAAGAAGSSVRHIVVKSSTLVYGSAASDPNTFQEDTVRTSPVKNSVERALVEAEGLVRDFAEDNPATKVTVLRFANVLGSHLTTPISRNLARPVCPSMFGFDPLLQFLEEDDVVRALLHVTQGGIPGLYNVAGDGRLPWSEVASICGTRLVPLSPWSPLKLRPLARLFDLPGRTRGSPALRPRRRHAPVRIDRLHLHLDQRGRRTEVHPCGSPAPAVRAAPRSYTYEHDVEQFFRHSPSIVGTAEG